MKYWVFDLDGTLVDSFSHYFKTLEIMFQERGRTFHDDQRLPALTEPLPQFFEKHLGGEAVSSALSQLQHLSNQDALKVEVFSGLNALLDELKQNGARFAVWTNRDLESAELIIKQTGLNQILDIWISGNCVKDRKPHPEGLLKIMRHFQCSPEEVTMVGDHEHDVVGAKSAGVRAIRASWHSYWEVEPCSRSDHQFHNVHSFRKWANDAFELRRSVEAKTR